MAQQENYSSYDDEHVVCDEGAIGISPYVAPGEEPYMYCDQLFSDVWDEVSGTCTPPPHVPTEEEMLAALYYRLPQTAAEQVCSAARESKTTVQRPLMIEFIHFGKRDRFPAELFNELAPVWRENLLREELVVRRCVLSQQDSFNDFIRLRNEIWGRASQFTAWFKEAFLNDDVVQTPTEEAYEKLLARCIKVFQSIHLTNVIRYLDLHNAGVELTRIRLELGPLNEMLERYRNQIIGGAESSEKIARHVEWAAFKFNDIGAKAYARVMHPNSPVWEAWYRFLFVFLPKGIGRATGAWTASFQGQDVWWNDTSARNIWRSVVSVVLEDGVDILGDMIKDLCKGKLVFGLSEEASEVVIEAVVKRCLTIVVGSFDILKWEKEPKMEKVREFMNRQAIGLVTEDLVKLGLAKFPRLKEIIPNCVGIIVADFSACQELSQKENRPLGDVMLSQFPETLFRILVQVVVVLLGEVEGGPLQNWVKATKAKKDAAKAAKEVARLAGSIHSPSSASKASGSEQPASRPAAAPADSQAPGASQPPASPAPATSPADSSDVSSATSTTGPPHASQGTTSTPVSVTQSVATTSTDAPQGGATSSSAAVSAPPRSHNESPASSPPSRNVVESPPSPETLTPEKIEAVTPVAVKRPERAPFAGRSKYGKGEYDRRLEAARVVKQHQREKRPAPRPRWSTQRGK